MLSLTRAARVQRTRRAVAATAPPGEHGICCRGHSRVAKPLREPCRRSAQRPSIARAAQRRAINGRGGGTCSASRNASVPPAAGSPGPMLAPGRLGRCADSALHTHGSRQTQHSGSVRSDSTTLIQFRLSPHRSRLVVSRSTCPPLSPSPVRTAIGREREREREREVLLTITK
jgi:hypothetical protein